MVKESTGVYILDKKNKPYELSKYQLFVREECAKLKKQNISIPGRGNTLIHIAKLWQESKTKSVSKIINVPPLIEKAKEDIDINNIYYSSITPPSICKSDELYEKAKNAKEDVIINNININAIRYFSNIPPTYKWGVQV